jgi:hypothetical protein
MCLLQLSRTFAADRGTDGQPLPASHVWPHAMQLTMTFLRPKMPAASPTGPRRTAPATALPAPKPFFPPITCSDLHFGHCIAILTSPTPAGGLPSMNCLGRRSHEFAQEEGGPRIKSGVTVRRRRARAGGFRPLRALRAGPSFILSAQYSLAGVRGGTNIGYKPVEFPLTRPVRALGDARFLLPGLLLARRPDL